MSSRALSVPAPRQRLVVEIVAVALVVFVAYALSRPDAFATLGRLYDDSVYLSVGKSIADGTGYRSVHLVGSPVHVKFPPLLPTVYALGWLGLGSLPKVAAYAMWLNIIITTASAAILWWFARRVLAVGAVTGALFVLAPLLTDRTMFYFTGATSEPWMLLGWSVALVLVHRLDRLRQAGRSAVAMAIALGITLALAVLARTQAIAVAASILLGVVVMRVGTRALLASFVSTGSVLLAWNVWHRAMMARGPLSPLPDQVSYMAWMPTTDPLALVSFASRMARLSGRLYWTNTADVLLGYTSPKTLMLGTAFLVCGIVGVVVAMRRFSALALSLVAMAAVLAVWPYVQDRFLTPVLPVLGLAAAYGVDQVLQRLGPGLRRFALGVAGLVAIAVLGLNARVRLESVRGVAASPFTRAINAMVAWIDSNTTPHEHIMVPWGGVVYLRTGRQTSIPNPEEATFAPSVFASPNKFLAGRILADSVDDVIVVEGATGRAAVTLRNLAAACPGLMTETPRNSAAVPNELRIYRVRRDVPCLNEFAAAEAGNGSSGNKNAP